MDELQRADRTVVPIRRKRQFQFSGRKTALERSDARIIESIDKFTTKATPNKTRERRIRGRFEENEDVEGDGTPG